MMVAGQPATRGKVARYRPMAEINVTPFVDVMLVLLVVFMITAPLLTVGVEVELPKVVEADNLAGLDEPLTVTVDSAGAVFLQELEVALDELAPKLRAVAAERPELRVFLRGDKVVAYGRVMEVMGKMNAAGIDAVGLVLDLPLPIPGDG